MWRAEVDRVRLSLIGPVQMHSRSYTSKAKDAFKAAADVIGMAGDSTIEAKVFDHKYITDQALTREVGESRAKTLVQRMF